ncbi:hypothetical protein, conserved [Plasmodium gonderi]|uniref:Cell cycle control protein cwf15 n=1 Tax=Plasmodium gonderi TaxID=77519 RepID=A0A1Y1JH13_PLAGO|nr:hypothetical protein, conserved [Plasmodium gonderi]GAW79364.1 hypothetical protein, conserved [Plasmodium gonderi]
MTTAHRPTWYNAIGGENQGGNRKVSQTAKVCSRDMPSHTKMKMRDLSDYMEEKEVLKKNLIQLENGITSEEKNNNSKKIVAIENIKKATNHEYTNPFPEDEDDEVEEEWKTRNRRRDIKEKKKLTKRSEKRHGQVGSQSDSEPDSQSDSEPDSQSDDEEEKELLRELENLKREKLEKQRLEKQEQELMKSKKNNVLTNNPLINLEDNSDDDEQSKNIARKRKWTDEAIFRNTCEKKGKKSTFINDTVRTSFHKKFLFKYIH